MSGAVSYHSGLAAEAQVEARYLADGLALAARRWRGAAGEIDLIFRQEATVVFVEVKRAETLATAAERLGPRQMARIQTTAAEFLAGEPAGQDSDVRFDVALVDGQGRIEIIANAIGI